MDDNQFRLLLEQLGLSWAGYRKVRKGVKKRIRRHMHRLGSQNVAVYLAELDKSDEMRQQCERLMTVSISRFFRDRKLWKVLQEKVLPELFGKETKKINVWSAGCSSGEEVYSLKIVWERLKVSLGHLPKLEILATDLNPAHLDRARRGVYSLSSLKEVPPEFRSLYFNTKADASTYAVRSSLKKNIIWRVHSFLSDPPGVDFNLIFLRNNLLTYYQDQQKKTALRLVIDSLKACGFLIIGSHETLPSETSVLLPCSSLSYIFKKGV